MTGIAIPRVINAAGHLSMLGGGVSDPAVAEAIAAAVRDAMTRPVEMAWMKDEASRRIAAATGADAGAVTTGAAAGIALSVAACVAGSALEAVRAVPFGIPRPVVLQAGHDIDFGAPVTQMVALGGGVPCLAGTRELVTPADLEAALGGAAAMVFIQSHHVTAAVRLSLAACIELAHAADVPVIVDAAAEENLRAYVSAGADLVIYSGGKALGALSSSGFVAGRRELVDAVRAQERGIGRAMKVGPEQILAVCIALDMYGVKSTTNDHSVLEQLMAGLAGVAAELSIEPDEAGRNISRLKVATPRAVEVARALREGDPPIFVRAHHAAEGYFFIDPRNLREDDVTVVVERLKAALGSS